MKKITFEQLKRLVKESTNMTAWEFEGGEDHDSNPSILEILQEVATGARPKAYRYDDADSGDSFIEVATNWAMLAERLISWGLDEDSACKVAKEIWALGVYETFDPADSGSAGGSWTRLV